MSIREFMEDVIQEMKERLGGDHMIGIQDILKNNDVTVHAVTIRRQGSDIAPCIHIDDIYGRYLAGDEDIGSSVDVIMRRYRGQAAGPGMDTLPPSDPREILSRVHGRLINTGMNQRLLGDVPHREYLDLSLVYIVGLPIPDGMAGSILIHDDHLRLWGMDEEDLYRAARRRMEDPDGCLFDEMAAVLGRCLGGDASHMGWPMYVLSNGDLRDGAVQMMNGHMLEEASDTMGHGDLLILPSSIHELILLPADGDDADPGRIQELAGIVREVNDTQIEGTEILSYHVYHYDRGSGRVTIAA